MSSFGAGSSTTGGTGQILARNKDTGQYAPIIESSQVRLLGAIAPPWDNIKVEQVLSGPFENPELINTTHIIVMKLHGDPSYTEWYEHGRLRRHAFQHGNMSFTPVGDVGRWSTGDTNELLIASIDDRLIQEIARELPKGFELRAVAPLVDPLLESALLALKTELENGCPGGRLYGDCIAATLGAHLLTKNTASTTESLGVKGRLRSQDLVLIADYIKSNYQKNISLTELSALVYMSPYHFSRLFKQSTGLSPYQYLLRCRIHRAIELLTAGRSSLQHIAEEVGFWDQSHLTRQFKKVTGNSPRSYLKKGR